MCAMKGGNNAFSIKITFFKYDFRDKICLSSDKGACLHEEV